MDSATNASEHYATMKPRLFSTLRCLQHENPLGLPRSGAPPQMPRMQRGLPQRRSIKDVKKVIAVSSAKGGVGKSTIAVNLALSFARRGYRAGILDTDIFGPSIPTLLNLSGEPRLSANNQLLPLSNYGLKSMSMGYLIPESSPVAWRGLMVMKALQQLLHEVDWGGLDVLVLDMPPGTGDVQLTITQQLILDGAVIVSTPQDLSLKDAVKGVELFRKVNVDLLGLVCNMAGFRCPGCGEVHEVFGNMEKIRKMCDKYDLSMLGEIPLHPSISDDADRGKPTVVAEPDGERALAFSKIAQEVEGLIGLDASRYKA
ncbi:Nn.00g060650.m01.CDS01 [Neocucurbitaria sp. VM-36]